MPAPEAHEGDALLNGNKGAYGNVMSSDYNLRGRPLEAMHPAIAD